jgi:hypothetical protein
MNWASILGFFITMLVNIPKAIGFTKDALEATKSGMEAFKAGQELLEKMDKPDQGAERAKIAAELMRAVPPIAWAEIAFYAVRGFFILVLFRWAMDLTFRHSRRKD